MSTKTSQAERDEAREILREYFPRDTYVTTLVLHTSQSGMSRAIAVVGVDDQGDPINVSHLVARATGGRLHGSHRGVVVRGAGMDMAFALVYDLAADLYGDPTALRKRAL